MNTATYMNLVQKAFTERGYKIPPFSMEEKDFQCAVEHFTNLAISSISAQKVSSSGKEPKLKKKRLYRQMKLQKIQQQK